jgi:hypothetical protein
MAISEHKWKEQLVKDNKGKLLVYTSYFAAKGKLNVKQACPLFFLEHAKQN